MQKLELLCWESMYVQCSLIFELISCHRVCNRVNFCRTIIFLSGCFAFWNGQRKRRDSLFVGVVPFFLAHSIPLQHEESNKPKNIEVRKYGPKSFDLSFNYRLTFRRIYKMRKPFREKIEVLDVGGGAIFRFRSWNFNKNLYFPFLSNPFWKNIYK